jgi:hypothetical protein
MERGPKVEVKEITSSDEQFFTEAARLVSKYSWGENYPIRPIDEIRSAEYRVGALRGNRLIGFGSVGRTFSPDAVDNGELWIAHAVVDPTFR